MKIQQKDTIKAVHDDNLIELLKNLKIYDKLINNEMKCFLCKSEINLENLNAIFPKGGDIKVACSSPHCISKLNSYLNEE